MKQESVEEAESKYNESQAEAEAAAEAAAQVQAEAAQAQAEAAQAQAEAEAAVAAAREELSAEDREELAAAQEDLDQGRSVENQNEGDLKAADEVQPASAEINIAAPVVTQEGAGTEGRVTIERAAGEDGGPKTEDRAAVAEAAPEVALEAGDEAIIDSNDGAGIVGVAERIDSATIIDSNDKPRDQGLTDEEPASGEMGDPDDLNQARERPDESPEGKAEDAVEDALDKATVAEGAAEAAERAEIKAQEAAKNHAQDTAALKEAIHEETNANEARAEAKLKYTYAQEHSSSDIEERREEYYDLCDKHNEAKESVEEAESKYYESHAEAEAAATAAAEAADAAAHAQAEAEAASAAAREAIANAQNKSSTGENHSDGGIPSTGLSPELESQLNTLSSKITPSSSTDGPTGG